MWYYAHLGLQKRIIGNPTPEKTLKRLPLCTDLSIVMNDLCLISVSLDNFYKLVEPDLQLVASVRMLAYRWVPASLFEKVRKMRQKG